jgi:dimethylargininase
VASGGSLALRAVVRGVPDTYDRCIVRSPRRPAIDVALARRQHRAYVDLLRLLGVEITALPPDPAFPDCVFVEDAAVVLDRCAIGCIPGEPSRRGEIDVIHSALAPFRALERMRLPATLEGGDVVAIDRTLYVGRSARTNEEGIATLGRIAAREGRTVVPVDLRGALHLKSAVTAARPDLLVGIAGAFDPGPFRGIEVLEVDVEETQGANVLPLPGVVLVSAAAPRVAERLEGRGVATMSLDISELEKGDGGLTCLSILVPS